MNTHNVTYLLGAGASYHAIPIMANFKEKFKKFLYLYWNHQSHPYQSLIFEFLTRTIKELDQAHTIDKHASILHRKNKYEYEAFKILICYYLLYIQLNKDSNENIISEDVKELGIYDTRYQELINRITTDDKIQSNVNIISWNYDFQLELNTSKLFDLSFEEVNKNLKIFPNSNIRYRVNEIDAKVVKMNGTAMFYDRHTNSYNNFIEPDSTFTKNDLLKSMDEIGKLLVQEKSNKDPMICYWFEANNEARLARKRAKSIIEQTNTLIIIGYSFPQDNREIDVDLFAKTENLGNIKYNIPEKDYNKYLRNLLNRNPNLKNLVTNEPDCTEFYLH